MENKNIRQGFKVEFDNILELCKYPEYCHVLRVGIQKNILTGLPAMSLDELEELSNIIKEFVIDQRSK